MSLYLEEVTNIEYCFFIFNKNYLSKKKVSTQDNDIVVQNPIGPISSN